MYRVYKMVDGYNLHNIYLILVHMLKSIFTWEIIMNFQPIAKIPGILTHSSSSSTLKMNSKVSSLEALA